MTRKNPDRPVIAVGALVIREERILLACRGQEPYAGKWSLPGGVVRRGERLAVAVRREIREECGIEVEVGSEVEVVERIFGEADAAPTYHYVILDYVARWVKGELVPSSDTLEARWILPADLVRYDLTPGTHEVILRLLEKAAKGAGRQA